MNQVRRRQFLLTTGALLAAPLAAAAQQAAKVWRIGYLAPGSRTAPQHEVLFRTLRELGYVEGSNAVFEARYAEGHFDRLHGFARELVRLNVDVIVASTNPAALQAKQVTAKIPIVVIGHDVVGTGLIKSLARPEANLTGIESLAPQLDAKRVEILKEILPRAARVALLYNPADSGMESHLKWTNAAAETLGIATLPFPVASPDAFTAVLDAVGSQRPDALLVFTDGLTFAKRKEIAQFAATNRLPAFFEFKEFVELGGLLAYGPNISDLWRRAGSYVDRLLKGSKPGDLPVEQPTRFELVINAKTARALNVTILPAVLLRADRVIE